MASVPSFGGSSSDPTIHTVPGDGATPASRMSDKKLPVVGFGLGATLHALPFQFISSVLCWPEPFAKEEDPNAQISVGDTAVIPCRLFDWDTLFGPMLGLVTTLQLAPSQCSISVNVAACFGGATGVCETHGPNVVHRVRGHGEQKRVARWKGLRGPGGAVPVLKQKVQNLAEVAQHAAHSPDVVRRNGG